jgi:hypothetical protein
MGSVITMLEDRSASRIFPGKEVELMKTSVLVFKGYVVDARSLAFCRYEKGKQTQYIPFSSSRGRAMLRGMLSAQKKGREWKTFDYVSVLLTALVGIILSALMIAGLLR